jgi:hypothetical protein
MEEYMEEIRKRVAENGFAIIPVGRDIQSGEQPFSYTVGLEKFIGREVILLGVPPKLSQAFLSDVAKAAKQIRSLEPGVYTGLLEESFPVLMIEAELEQVREKLVFAYALSTEQHDIRALQLVLPDPGRRMPWEPGYNMFGQRLLLNDPDSPETMKTLSELPTHNIEAIVRGPAPDQPIH